MCIRDRLGRWIGEISLTAGTYDKKVGNIEIGGPFSIGDMLSLIHISEPTRPY